MKISPITNYTKPKYAVKLAALLAAAVSVSACAEGGGKPVTSSNGSGAGYKPETTEEVRLGGEAETSEKTEEIMLDGDVAIIETTSEEPQVDGYLDVPEETAEEVQVDGMLEGPEETTGAVSGSILGALGSMAVTTAAAGGTTLQGTSPVTEDTTKYEPAELEGEADTTSEYEEPQLMGDFPVTEYEEPQLDGDVAMPEIDWESERICTAENNFYPLNAAFSQYEKLRFTLIEGFENDVSCKFVMGDPDGNETEFIAPYLIEIYDEDGMYWKKCAYATFVTPDDPFAGILKDIPGKKLEGGYLAENDFFTFGMLFIEVGPDGNIHSDDFCDALAASFAKEVGAV